MVRVNSRVAPAGARVPDARIRHLNPNAARPNGRYVLYWMTSARRLEYNFALQRAVEACREFSKPLVILEAVRCDYPYASDRLHRFVLDGMAEHRTALAGSPVEDPGLRRTGARGWQGNARCARCGRDPGRY